MAEDSQRVSLPAQLTVLGPLVDWAEGLGHDLADLEVRRPSLEDIYLKLTGANRGEPS